MRKIKKTLFTLLLLIISCFQVISAENTTPEPYKKGEFPGWLKDLRRAEIITLGAMPFITFNVALGYWGINGFNESYSPFYSPTDSSIIKYTNEETIGILLTSLGICTGIGITDFIVHSIRQTKLDKNSKYNSSKSINIESIKDDPEAYRIELPDNNQNEFDDYENLELENEIIE